jgi:ABC-type dipeptide/oligopeptide/nickel transport system ATPase component
VSRSYEDVRHSHPLIRYVQKRLYKQNKNWLAMLTGATGSGKSWSALSLAKKIDPDFSTDQVVLRPESFLEGVKDREFGQGDVVVFDEAGAGMNAKEHMTMSNRVIDQVLQTFRRQNIAVIFTVPSQANTDRSVRRLLHAYLETKTIDYKRGHNVLKWLKMELNRRQDKVYYKYPRVEQEDGSLKKVDTVRVPKPPEVLVEAYEDKRSRYQDAKNEELLEDLVDSLDLNTTSSPDEASKKEKIKDAVKDLENPSTSELADTYNTSPSYVSQIRSEVES